MDWVKALAPAPAGLASRTPVARTSRAVPARRVTLLLASFPAQLLQQILHLHKH
jgi:hypothetical protein